MRSIHSISVIMLPHVALPSISLDLKSGKIISLDFDLPPLDTFSLFVTLWLRSSQHFPLHLVRFEESKANPHRVLRNVLAFLNIQRTDQEIEHAISSSDFASHKRVMLTMEDQTGKAFKTTRRGLSGEWSSTYSPFHLGLTSPFSYSIIDHLSYGNKPSYFGFEKRFANLDVLDYIQSFSPKKLSNKLEDLYNTAIKPSSTFEDILKEIDPSLVENLMRPCL